MSGLSPCKSHAPVINPFDKLTQNQFDSYVTNIQAKIQVALNPPSPQPHHVSRSIAEISQSTIASPAPSPAPLSKRQSLEPHTLSKIYTPLGAGTPNEPFELSDDGETDELELDAKDAPSASDDEADVESEAEPEPLSAIPEATDEGDYVGEDVESDEADYSGYNGQRGNEPGDDDTWPFSGEDASDDEEISGAEEAEEEEEDTFVGKGKGRHPAEGPGLAALLNGSSGNRTGGSTQTPERSGRSLRTLDDSFDEDARRMPSLGTTSTPFISRVAARQRFGPSHSADESDEDEESPPWDLDQGLSMPAVAVYQGNESDDEQEEYSDEGQDAGIGQENAIEVLDSDEEPEVERKTAEPEVDEIAPSPAPTDDTNHPHDIYAGMGEVIDHQEFDELQFDDSTAFTQGGNEPDSLLDDTMDPDNSAQLAIPTGAILPGPSSLFSASSVAVTREPSQSRDAEELEQSADTVQAPEYSVEEPMEPEPSMDQHSIQQSLDYSDFIGEHSLLAQPESSFTITQAEQHLQEVTIYELENGSRYYDYDGMRHFLNSDGEVYETAVIPPPRPTIQQLPDLSMIEEVTEYDMTRRLGEGGESRFDYLRDIDDTFSSVGGSVLRYPEGGDSMAFGIDDIPQRPGAAMGFRVRDEGASAFLSDSAVLGEDLINESVLGEQYGILSHLEGGTDNGVIGTVEDPMTGRNSGDLVSDVDDLVSASEVEGDEGDTDSQDSILDDNEDNSREVDRSGVNRDELITPVPSEKANKGVVELDEKSVADAMAAVAQLAENASFEDIMGVTGVQGSDINNPMFDAPNLDNLMDEVSNMSAVEEDILARSFNMADAMQNISVALNEVETIGEGTETFVGTSVLGEADHSAAAMSDHAPEKLASDVLAEVFEGVETNILPSVATTGTTTPSADLEPTAHIEEIQVSSRSSTPIPPRRSPNEVGNQDPSPRRTPPTPTLSIGQSLTAPELSIATSVSGHSIMQANVSVYESSPTSSTHQEGSVQVELPEDSDVTQLPDPTLPPAPTHLSMPAVPSMPEVSPSVMVEPPTPHTRSEDGEANQDTKGADVDEENEASAIAIAEGGAKEKGARNENKVQHKNATQKEELEEKTKDGSDIVVVKQTENEDEDVDVVGPHSQDMSTPNRKSRTRSPSARASTGESSNESRLTPTPSEKKRAGDKRKRLIDGVPSPRPGERTPLKLSIRSPNRTNELPKSPLSEDAPSPNTPTPRNYQSLFKRTPTAKPISTASGSSSRKTSGSDTAPAPWPMRHRTHNHALAVKNPMTSPNSPKATSSSNSPVTRSNCRFHKVTIPVDDSDSSIKVEFIVPGCALGHNELMKEQNIEDCGMSTPEEENIMITKMEDIEPRIINKLTILVGAALFNEGVCGYLPTSSVPKVSRSIPARSNSLKGSLGRSTNEAKFEYQVENRNKSPNSQVKPKLRSRPSIHHDDRLFKPPTEETESDDTIEDEPTRKRPKIKRRETAGSTSSVKFPSLGQDSPQKPLGATGSQQSEARILISKRMKRARKPADAQPFKPEPNQEESSQDDGRSPRKRTKRRTTAAVHRTNSSTPAEEPKYVEGEENPFKPKNELKRVLSPEATARDEPDPNTSSALDLKPTATEQKDLEQHIELGDRPGEVVDEDGGHVSAEALPGPAPAKVAAYVDREAPSEVGKKESNGAGENALGANSVSKKGWGKYLRF